MHGSALLAGLALVLSASGCLPPDNRPTPGSVYVTTEPSSANFEEVITSDGWRVSFERLLAGVGNLELEGDGCNSYSEARYSRLFDFTVPAEPQKVGITYAWATASSSSTCARPPTTSRSGSASPPPTSSACGSSCATRGSTSRSAPASTCSAPPRARGPRSASSGRSASGTASRSARQGRTASSAASSTSAQNWPSR